MTIKRIYQILLLERECAVKRDLCSKDCENCEFYVNKKEAREAFDRTIKRIKEMDPMLYFSDELTTLRELISMKMKGE